MKKIYLLVLGIFAMILSSTDSTAQSISWIYLQDSCQVSGLLVHVQLTSGAPNQEVHVHWGDGQSDTIALQSTQGTVYPGHVYTSIGTYTVKVMLYRNGSAVDSATSTHNATCSIILLEAYIDKNNNCVRDKNIDAYPLSKIDVEIDSAGTIIDTISMVRGYGYKGVAGVVYKFRALNAPTGSSISCPTNGTITVTAPQPNSTVIRRFGFNCNNPSQFDLAVVMVGRFRPVATSRLYIYAFNKSCAAKNGVVTLQHSGKYSYKSANPTPTSVSGNTITWNLNNLVSHQSKAIQVNFDTATTLSINDTVCNHVTITPISGDVVPANNTLNQCDKIRTSWDPNDKSVIPSGDILPGTKLTYTINFENLGNDTAFNIHILDTLSDNVDVQSFKLEESSHAVTHAFIQNSINKNIIRFDFADILLADKSAPEHNKGFVTFSINAKQGLAPLTQINNRAGIYFDINPVVLTNYAENRIAPVGIEELNKTDNINLYPNPVTNTLTIQANSNQYRSLKLFNNIGQVVAEQNINSNTTQINMKQLPTGMYYIQLQGVANIVTRKVEKL